MKTIDQIKRMYAAPLHHPITCANPAPWKIADVAIDVDPLKVWIRGNYSMWFRMDQCFVHDDENEVKEFVRAMETKA